MKKRALATVAMLAVGSIATVGFADTKGDEGKKEFEEHCAVCHPKGGNVVNPKFTLQKKDREANGVKTAKDIIGKMRNPGPGMTKFDTKTISNKKAKAIAEYILKTF